MVIREGGSWDPYITLAEGQAATPWEDHGLEGDPAFWDYDLADHALHDGSWPDFHLIAASAAIDHGTTTLPASLVALLDAYGVEYDSRGAAYDMGRYEAGFSLRSNPASRSIEPGGEAYYTLSLDPSDLPHPVMLSVDTPSPDLTATLSASTLDPTGTVTLTVTHHGPATTQWYSISVSGSGGGFMSTTNVLLLVNGYHTYLPLVNARTSAER
jgi:hypothetical protein